MNWKVPPKIIWSLLKEYNINPLSLMSDSYFHIAISDQQQLDSNYAVDKFPWIKIKNLNISGLTEYWPV